MEQNNQSEIIQTHCGDCETRLCEKCGECHSGCFLSAPDCIVEQSINILAEACDRADDNAVDSLLHAIYYLRIGKYPFNRVEVPDVN